MEIEHKKVVTVKIQWGKKKFDFGWDATEDLDTIKCKPDLSKTSSTL